MPDELQNFGDKMRRTSCGKDCCRDTVYSSFGNAKKGISIKI
jgi:hypothetical protein